MAVIAKYCSEISIELVDVNEQRINDWNSDDLSKLPIYEPGLEELVRKNRGKNLFFSTDLKSAIEKADMIFISVNTPTKTKGLGAGYASDLKWVESSAREVAKYATGHTIVVEKSTVPVRTAELIAEILKEAKFVSANIDKSKTFSVLSSPEFLAEGTAISDLENPDRVLIGGTDKKAISSLSQIYERWIPKKKILLTNLWSSELSKLSANAFLAQRISSINSISALCESTGAEIKEVSKAIGSDQRIGTKFLEAGPGFGGSCFKKDILNLVYLCRFYQLNEVANYWEQVLILNDWQKSRISKLIVEKFFGTVTNKKISILGFSFKSNTNDIRESAAIDIAKDLIENGANLYIHDPKVTSLQIQQDLGKPLNDNINLKEGGWIFTEEISLIFDDVDAIVIVTEWNDYIDLDWPKLIKKMKRPSWIFDTRNILEKELFYEIIQSRLGYKEQNSYRHCP